MEPLQLLRARRPVVDRASDRRVALAAILLALGFLAAALASLALPAGVRRGIWLPLHLALAGGASSAIAGVMPFFVAAFAAAPPADTRLRAAALGGVALGAALVAGGVVGSTPVAVVGGLAFIAGIALTAVALVRPLSGSLGPSRGIVTSAYLLALGAVAIGAGIATMQTAGMPAIAEAWARLRPVHAWLNVVGFASLVTATTLLHFFPTVVGSRIVAHPSARWSVVGIAGGSFLVGLGYLLAVDLAVQVGASGALLGALALASYAIRIWRARARWTTDPEWHRMAIGGLASAIAWFVVGMAILAGRAWLYGVAPSGWSIQPVMAPLIGGWIGLAILSAATHLLPAIGPGDQRAHARQRELLGTAAVARLALLNFGVATLMTGEALGLPAAHSAGVVSLGLGFATTAGLLVWAAWVGVRRR